ncbi:ABC transporter permease [Escherichia coli]|nr:ABC transporter permease [Escherichia coli]
MVWQWIAVVPANAGHYRGADAYPVLAVDPQNGAGDVYRSRCINIRAAKNAGVNTRIIVMLTYVLSGLCAAIAGIIVAADIRGADANNAGLWLELDAILAVVIGGGSLMGGRFNLLLSVVGALIIQGMNTGILLSGFPPEMNQVVKAVVVLCVLIVQSQRFISLIKGVRSRDKT